MKILIIGKNGQIGWELNRSLLPLGEMHSVTHKQLDLTDLARLQSYLQKIDFDVIVNAAAYTAVDQAESETQQAILLNAEAQGVIAEQAKRMQALLIHYSTDYVFDGSNENAYVESDPTNPINSYGQSKLAGEQAIEAAGCDHLILRTSWVYANRGNNFLKTILRLAKQREELSIVADQFGAPTWARLIADSTAHIIRQSTQERQQQHFNSQIYNLTSSGKVSWHGFAEAIIKCAKDQGDASIVTHTINAIPSVEYPVPAKRPLNSSLATEKLEQHFGLKMPDWSIALQCCIN